MSEITTEKLQTRDLGRYRALLAECFTPSECRDSFEGLYDPDGDYSIVVAKDGETVVGAVTMIKLDLFTFRDRPVLMLFDVCVSAAKRRSGTARTLMQHALAYGRKHGCRSVSLTCLESASDAHAFYESLGFKKAPSRKYVLAL